MQTVPPVPLTRPIENCELSNLIDAIERIPEFAKDSKSACGLFWQTPRQRAFVDDVGVAYSPRPPADCRRPPMTYESVAQWL